MKSKLFHFGAGLAVAALVSLSAMSGAQAQATEAYDRGDSTTPARVTVTFDATAVAAVTLAVQAPDGVYGPDDNVTITWSGTSTGIQVTGPTAYSFIRGTTDLQGVYLFPVYNAVSSSGAAATSTISLRYSEDAGSTISGRMYSGNLADATSFTEVADLNPVTVGGYYINATPLSVNTAYKGPGFSLSGSVIPSFASNESSFDQVSGVAISDADPEGTNIIAILAVTAEVSP